MKALLFALISIALSSVVSASTNEMHYYDSVSFILNHLKLPAVGEVKNMQDTKTFNNVTISKKADKNGWPYIALQSAEGSFVVHKHVDPGLFEELSATSQVQSGHANSIWVGCKYLLGQKELNWFSPFDPHCTLSF